MTATRAVAVVLAAVGALVVIPAFFLLAAVAAVALQGKPPDILSTTIGLVLLALGALALRSAWSRWHAAEPAPDRR